MKKTLTNFKMDEMRRQLQPLMSYRDKIGYLAARNYRKLMDALTEYDTFRDALIAKYGEPDRDESGAELPTVSLNIRSPQFQEFRDELTPFGRIEHEVELMMGQYKDAIGTLTGEEILRIDWMLDDQEGGTDG